VIRNWLRAESASADAGWCLYYPECVHCREQRALLQTLVHQILGKSEEELKHWRDAIRKAIEPNGQLIINLIPQLELVIGPQPLVPELPAQETRRRFQAVFGRFLGVFARKEHPLILFLDDLQWVDTATPKVLEQLASRPETQYLLINGAYRDNEVSPSHPLRLMLNSIRRAGVAINEIVLKPLSLRDINLLIARPRYGVDGFVGGT
jgi:predicted ATPase